MVWTCIFDYLYQHLIIFFVRLLIYYFIQPMLLLTKALSYILLSFLLHVLIIWPSRARVHENLTVFSVVGNFTSGIIQDVIQVINIPFSIVIVIIVFNVTWNPFENLLVERNKSRLDLNYWFELGKLGFLSPTT